MEVDVLTTKKRINNQPSNLNQAGRELWGAVTGQYDLAGHELAILGQACRVLDLAESLSRRVKREGAMSVGSQGQQVVHPLLSEARQQRALFGQLMRTLALPDLPATSADGGLKAVPNQHRQAAGSRWSKAYGA